MEGGDLADKDKEKKKKRNPRIKRESPDMKLFFPDAMKCNVDSSSLLTTTATAAEVTGSSQTARRSEDSIVADG